MKPMSIWIKTGRKSSFWRPYIFIAREGKMWRLKNIFSEQKVLRSTFKVLALSEDKIVLREVDGVGQKGIQENRRRI